MKCLAIVGYGIAVILAFSAITAVGTFLALLGGLLGYLAIAILLVIFIFYFIKECTTNKIPKDD